MRKAACLLMLVACCNTDVAQMVDAEAGRDIGSPLVPGVYRGDLTCTGNVVENGVFTESGSTGRDIVEIDEDGLFVLNGHPLIVGHVDTVDLLDRHAEVRVTRVTATQTGLVITRSADGSIPGGEATGTWVMILEMTPEGHLIAEEIRQYTVVSSTTTAVVSNDCRGVLVPQLFVGSE